MEAIYQINRSDVWLKPNPVPDTLADKLAAEAKNASVLASVFFGRPEPEISSRINSSSSRTHILRALAENGKASREALRRLCADPAIFRAAMKALKDKGLIEEVVVATPAGKEALIASELIISRTPTITR